MNKDKKIYYLGGVNAVGKSAFEREPALVHPDRFQVVHGAGKLMGIWDSSLVIMLDWEVLLEAERQRDFQI